MARAGTANKNYRGARAGKGALLAVYALAHLLVDMCCCAALLRFTRGTDYFAMSLFIYNFCAFALQMPIGAFADGMTKTGPLSVVGCVTVALSMIAAPAPYVLAAMLGVGNACFHVGGGVYSMRAGSGCSRLGVFVSPGAVGLVIGRIVSDMDAVADMMIMTGVAVIMVVSALLIILAEPFAVTYESVAPFAHGINVSYPGRKALACACFFIVVALRSFGGLTFVFDWKSTITASHAALLTAAAAAFGKMLGGIVSDRVGMKATSAFTLTLSAVLMLWSANMYTSLFALLLFNMTMPITLRAAADNVRGHEGFAFGFCTLALFVGYIPAFIGVTMPFGIYGNAAVAVISLAFMAAGLEFTSHGAGKRK